MDDHATFEPKGSENVLAEGSEIQSDVALEDEES